MKERQTRGSDASRGAQPRGIDAPRGNDAPRGKHAVDGGHPSPAVHADVEKRVATAARSARTLFLTTLRTDRLRIAPWVVLISILSASSILAYRWVFPDLADREEFALAIGSNTAMELVFGRARDLLTDDGFNAWRAGQLGALFAALMGILTTIRNTRAAEDSGQAELVASGVITRRGRLAAALGVSTFAAIALGVLCFLLTWASGGLWEPSALIAATFTCSALVFAGVAAIAAQLSSDAQTAQAMSLSTMGVLYLIRGYCDSSRASEWTQWTTPFGWFERTHIATGNDWSPIVVSLIAALILLGIAVALQERRDFGRGVITPRPRPARAPRMRLLGLTLRLHRNALITWLLSFAFLGFVFGNLASSMGNIIAKNPLMAKMLATGSIRPGEIAFVFVSTILGVTGIIAAVMGTSMILRAYTEQTSYRLEPLLAGAVTRTRYYGVTVGTAFAAQAVAMSVSGVALGIVAGGSYAAFSMGDVVAQALCTIPAVWVLSGIAAAMMGADPRKRIVGWLVIVASFAITMFGPTFKFPDWALAISPLHHVPEVISPSPAWVPLGVLCLIAAALVAIGRVGFNRRDVA